MITQMTDSHRNQVSALAVSKPPVCAPRLVSTPSLHQCSTKRVQTRHGNAGAAYPHAEHVRPMLFASGCELLISVTSAGQITPAQSPPYFILLCFAHVTNQMGRIEGDFEKGEANGVTVSLAVVHAVTRAVAAASLPVAPS
jgi:hypothetical protein